MTGPNSLRAALFTGAALPETIAMLRFWRDRNRSRRHLRALAPHLLPDIGLSEAQRQREAAKPFWRD